MNEYKLYRCKFLKITKNYILGKDVFNSTTYKIIKNDVSRHFKVGYDDSFYATAEKKGLLLTSIILNPIDYNQVIKEKELIK